MLFYLYFQFLILHLLTSVCQPYHLHVPTVLKSGSLNLLEPYGPVQACNGIALPLCFYLYLKRHVSAHASEPPSGLFQELTYTVVCLKVMRSYITT
jgi:hypothetical protein